MQEPEVVLARLGAAFAELTHDLDPATVARDRRSWVEGLVRRGLDRLSPADLDLLVFRAISTVGGLRTFKYALSRFLGVMIEAPGYGSSATSDAYVILPKLDHAGFADWPQAQRRAILEALELWADRRVIAATSQGRDPEAKAILEWVNARRHLL